VVRYGFEALTSIDHHSLHRATRRTRKHALPPAVALSHRGNHVDGHIVRNQNRISTWCQSASRHRIFDGGEMESRLKARALAALWYVQSTTTSQLWLTRLARARAPSQIAS
jgi:hypothetical protein